MGPKKDKEKEEAREAQVHNLYLELNKLNHGQDWEKALKVCNRILNVHPGDATAFHCKIVCLVQLAKFEAVLEQVDLHEKVMAEVVGFEVCYSLYRLNRPLDALQRIQQIKDQDNNKVKELKAQVLYR